MWAYFCWSNRVMLNEITSITKKSIWFILNYFTRIYQYKWTDSWMFQKCTKNIKCSNGKHFHASYKNLFLCVKVVGNHKVQCCFIWNLHSAHFPIKYLLNNHIFICRHSYECTWNLSAAFILRTMFNSN